MKQIKDNTSQWFKAAGIRALKTFAQTMIATIGTTAVIENVEQAARPMFGFNHAAPSFQKMR